MVSNKYEEKDELSDLMRVIAYVRHGERDSTPATMFRDGSPGTIPCFLTPVGIDTGTYCRKGALTDYTILVCLHQVLLPELMLQPMC